MIRPFTLVCMLLACASGLYLYQAKHRVRMLDREISRTVQATTAARDRAGMLRTEWTLLNDLERLRLLADQFLALKPLAPSQFTSLVELAARLPAPRAAEPQADDPPAVAVQEPARPADPPQAAVAAAARPAPEARAKPTRLASVQTVAARPPPVRQAAYATRADIVAAPRLAVSQIARPQPMAHPQQPLARLLPADGQAPPFGSALGMARSALPPPVPVNATAGWLAHDGN